MGKIDKKLLIALLGEFLAAYFAHFIGCMEGGWTFGLGILAVTQIFRIISGAHINPCITIAAMILKQIEIVPGLLFILVQLIGTLLGFLCAYGLTIYPHNTNICSVVNVRIFPWFLMEFLTTGAWVFAMCASWHPSNQEVLESISLRIGLVVVTCTFAGNVAMNPFRALWPAIVNGLYDGVYIPLIVPPVTAALLALAWRFIYVGGTEAASESPEQ